MGTTSATAAQEILDDGGIPNDVSSNSGTLSQVTFLSVWVEAQINGRWVEFDPALKSSTWYAPANFKTLMGYNRSAVRADAGAMASGSVITPGVAGALTAELTTEASNLLGQLSTPAYSQSMNEQVLGGHRIIPVTQTALRQTTLPEAGGNGIVWAGDIPNAFRVTLSINLSLSGKSPSVAPASNSMFGDDYYNTKYAVSAMTPNFGINFLGINIPPFISTGLQPVYQPFTNSSSTSIWYEQLQWDTVTIHIHHPYASNGGLYADQIYSSPTFAPRTESVTIDCGFNCRTSQSYAVTTALHGVTVVLGKESERFCRIHELMFEYDL